MMHCILMDMIVVSLAKPHGLGLPRRRAAAGGRPRALPLRADGQHGPRRHPHHQHRQLPAGVQHQVDQAQQSS